MSFKSATGLSVLTRSPDFRQNADPAKWGKLAVVQFVKIVSN